MIYYVKGIHSQLALLLLEMNSSSLSRLFEDALEVDENIYASRRIQKQYDFENQHVLELAEGQCVLEFKLEDNGCKTILEQQQEHVKGEDIHEQRYYNYEAISKQQQATEIVSDCKSNYSTWVEYSRDKYSYKIYDQFTKHVESMITYDGIDNYIFRADHDLCQSNTTLSSSFEHYSEEKAIVFDDYEVITKEKESHQPSGTEEVIEEKFFPEYQHVLDISLKIQQQISQNLTFQKT